MGDRVDPSVASWIAAIEEVQSRTPATASTELHDDSRAEARRDQADLSGSDADYFADHHENIIRGSE